MDQRKFLGRKDDKKKIKIKIKNFQNLIFLNILLVFHKLVILLSKRYSKCEFQPKNISCKY